MGLCHRKRCDFEYGQSTHLNGPALFVEPCSSAAGTGAKVHITFYIFPGLERVGFHIPPFQRGNNAVERFFICNTPVVAFIIKRDLRSAGSVQ